MNYGRENEESAWIGIKICDFSPYGQGLGKKYLSMLIRSLFEDFGYQRIVLDTSMENLRTQHVYERLGFRRVRVRTAAWADQLGELRSAVDYELKQAGFMDFVK